MVMDIYGANGTQQATMAYKGGGLATSDFYILNDIHLWQIAQNP